jgi:hypothetical protein
MKVRRNVIIFLVGYDGGDIYDVWWRRYWFSYGGLSFNVLLEFGNLLIRIC